MILAFKSSIPDALFRFIDLKSVRLLGISANVWRKQNVWYSNFSWHQSPLLKFSLAKLIGINKIHQVMTNLWKKLAFRVSSNTAPEMWFLFLVYVVFFLVYMNKSEECVFFPHLFWHKKLKNLSISINMSHFDKQVWKSIVMFYFCYIVVLILVMWPKWVLR